MKEGNNNLPENMLSAEKEMRKAHADSERQIANRMLSDADLYEGGADYKYNDSGKLYLDVTDAQVEAAHGEMEQALSSKPESVLENQEKKFEYYTKIAKEVDPSIVVRKPIRIHDEHDENEGEIFGIYRDDIYLLDDIILPKNIKENGKAIAFKLLLAKFLYIENFKEKKGIQVRFKGDEKAGKLFDKWGVSSEGYLLFLPNNDGTTRELDLYHHGENDEIEFIALNDSEVCCLVTEKSGKVRIRMIREGKFDDTFDQETDLLCRPKWGDSFGKSVLKKESALPEKLKLTLDRNVQNVFNKYHIKISKDYAMELPSYHGNIDLYNGGENSEIEFIALDDSNIKIRVTEKTGRIVSHFIKKGTWDPNDQIIEN